jgi:hypothetical protein
MFIEIYIDLNDALYAVIAHALYVTTWQNYSHVTGLLH